MNPGDRLLYAISAKVDMSWSLFKKTFDFLCSTDLKETTSEDIRFLRNETSRVLDALGHIETEFLPSNAWVHVAPSSVITAKAANGYHFKTGHSTSVRDRFLYSFGVN